MIQNKNTEIIKTTSIQDDIINSIHYLNFAIAKYELQYLKENQYASTTRIDKILKDYLHEDFKTTLNALDNILIKYNLFANNKN